MNKKETKGMRAMINPQIWTDADFEDIDDFTSIAFYIYLMANNACSTIGIYKLSMRVVSNDTRLDKRAVLACIADLAELDPPKVMYDNESKYVFVVGLFKHNIPAIKNKSIAKSVMKQIEDIKESPFYNAFMDKYSTSVSLVQDQCDTVIGKGIGNGKDNSNKKEYTDDFEKFWKAYPRRLNKLQAFQAWLKERKASDAELISAASAYAVYCLKENMESKYIKHPATWINQCCWEDDYGTQARKAVKQDYSRYEDEVRQQIGNFKRLQDYTLAVLDKYSGISGFEPDIIAIKEWRKTYGKKNER